MDARVGPMEACHTAYLQVGLLLQQVEHRCQWSTTHRGAYSGYLEEPAALDCLAYFIYVFSYYTGMFQSILGFFLLHCFSLYQGFLSVWRFFPLSALAMYSKLTTLHCGPSQF